MAQIEPRTDPNPSSPQGAQQSSLYESTMKMFKEAKKRRDNWVSTWDEINDYVLPGREGFFDSNTGSESFGNKRTDLIYDETAVVGVPRFASRLQLGFFPPNGRSFRLMPGPEYPGNMRSQRVMAELDNATDLIHEGLRNSNFNSELHEGLQDLGIGTMNMICEPGRFVGDLKFTAVPATHVALLPSKGDEVGCWFHWRNDLRLRDLQQTYPHFTLSPQILEDINRNPDKKMKIIEATMVDQSKPFEDAWIKVCISETHKEILYTTGYVGSGSNPWISTRWSKSGFEVWGRGPILQAMPAIKTLNLTVKLILENAEMAIAGAYMYDDDGVFNPENIILQPGTFVPRAAGSKIEPLQSPSRFDVAQLVLEEQRRNVRKALFIDELEREGAKTPLSATEVSQRLAEVAIDIVAVAGRMQREFLQPLVNRIVYIYKEMGLLELPRIDGREIRVVPVSPLLRAQDQQDVSDFMRFSESIMASFGPQMAMMLLNRERTVKWLASKFGIDEDLLNSQEELQAEVEQAANVMQQMQGAEGGQPPGIPGQGGPMQ